MLLLSRVANICLIAGLVLSGIAGAASAAPEAALAQDADIYLVPIGPVPSEILQKLAERYHDLAGLKVETTAELPLPDWTIDPGRRQIIAEQARALMMRVFEPWKAKPWAMVVAVTAHDIYIANTTWRFAYAFGEGKYALVSVARMIDAQSTLERWSPQLLARLTRMLDKRVAIQYFGYGSALPAPEVLKRPVLSIEDLDDLDASALEEALRTAAGPARPERTLAPAISPVQDDATDAMPIWLLSALAAAGVSAILGLIMLVYYKARSAPGELREQAQARGWGFSEEATPWYQPSRCFVEGEEGGVPFRLDWFQIGSGKSARRKTLWVCETGSDIQLSVVPSPGLWGSLITKRRQRTRDAHYNCHFLVQGAGEIPALPDNLRALHLELPATVNLHDGLLEVVYDGHADAAKTDHLVTLALAWLGYARGQTQASSASGATQGSTWDVLGCAFSKTAGLLFWLLTGGALLGLFGFVSEEGNLPWEIAGERVMPFALLIWSSWLLWRWRTRYFPGGRVGDTVLSVLFLGLFWLMSGAWVLGWNALIGEQREVLVVGPVTEKRKWQDKRGEQRALTLTDITSYRQVEVHTDPATYERLRVGDPVGFEFIRGSLGIYYQVRWR